MSSASLRYSHGLKNALLILLSLIFFPVDSLVLLTALLYRSVSPLVSRRKDARRLEASERKTILVTGVGMTKGLVLARSFYEAGHRVVGADFHPFACGRASKSLFKFVVLPKPDERYGSSHYVKALLDLIKQEHIDLWVSCSAVASAVEDGEAKEIIEARTTCKAVQFDVATTQKLHEKYSFIAYCQEIGLTVPETISIATSNALEEALQKTPARRKYIMKPVGVDDANRADMTLLPKASWKETQDYISKLKISAASPWILQQFVQGPEYCTHSVVINGQVKAFVACPSAELLMHYEALPSDSELSRAMLKFTERIVEDGGPMFSGHLSFDFMVEASSLKENDEKREVQVFPIECNPRAHTANVLFNGHPEIPEAYLSLLHQSEKTSFDGATGDSIICPKRQQRYYWIGHDLVELVLLQILSLLTMDPEASISQLANGTSTFFSHVINRQDGTFEWWDPGPWWMLYHVYWPLQFLQALRTGKAWSRINVSTTKMFAC